MPALAFSLAMLARLGPLLAVDEDFWIPAVALALDHREPKASPPEDLDAAGLAAVEGAVAELKEVVDGMPGRWPERVEGDWAVLLLAWTEVK